MASLYQKIKYHGSALAFIAGFIWDNVMLRRIDHPLSNIILGFYLGLSAISILAMNMRVISVWRAELSEKLTKWLPLVLQFCFGSLFSAYIVFYTRSASLSTDWPFLLFLAVLVISNELFRKRYLSITLPVSLFFTVLFSYSIFSLPTLLHSMGLEIFILSGALSLLIVVLLLLLLGYINPEGFQTSRRSLFASITVIYVLFNLAYFSKVIPPVPLSLKEIGVYHFAARSANQSYTLAFEPGFWYPLISETAPVFHRHDNEPVYVWSSVFAPEKLTVPVFHLWQYFDETDKVWVATDLVQFPIVGGRDGGFRGYSMKSSVFPARWRVDVLTARKDLIGRVEFTIENTASPSGNVITETR